MITHYKNGMAAAFFAVILISCQKEKPVLLEPALIPYPDQIEFQSGLSTAVAPFQVIQTGFRDSVMTSFLEADGFAKEKGSRLELVLDTIKQFPEEGYELKIGTNAVQIIAGGTKGLFYGIQTLKQLCQTREKLPLVTIGDSPRFGYRGMHLDVSRHFYPTDFIKKQLDLMAYYKMNRFHWHLTDGAGWRLEIKKYPKLTQLAAWRPYENWKAWWRGGREYCSQDAPGAEGGYYTQQEVRDIVAYAAARHITIIPEIELPAHSEEVLAVYPELSCSGEPYKHADFCVGNEKTFAFLQDVFDEVIDLFPGEMIHIGGDEAGKQAWKSCPKCQRRMKENGLEDVDQLQSYMVGRIGNYLMSKGKTFVGWDEILEGGLAKGAVVMSWRGEEGGIKSVKMGHQAIMTPGGYCYLDAYQQDPATQPEAIGGYLPLEKVYSYNPVPDSLSAEEARLILGVQGNLWTEYISTPDHVEYMLHPRLEAIAEVGWSKTEKKSWDHFKPRINKHMELLKLKKVNACPMAPDVTIDQSFDSLTKRIVVHLNTDLYPATIYYTLDGTEPDQNSKIYSEALSLSESRTLRSVIYQDGKPVALPKEKELVLNKAIGKKIAYNCVYSDRYPAGGDLALINGLYGGFGYGDGRWQGFENDMDLTIDLGETTKINRVQARFMQIVGPWIWLPVSVEVSVSNDGVNFTTISKEINTIPDDSDEVIFSSFGFQGKAQGRYVRYKAGYNGKGFLFTDELVID